VQHEESFDDLTAKVNLKRESSWDYIYKDKPTTDASAKESLKSSGGRKPLRLSLYKQISIHLMA
jgi:hypothetical protein